MIRKRGKAYQVLVPGFSARTVYTRDAANKLEADLKNRKALGHLYEAKPHTLDQELLGFDDRRDATTAFRPRTIEGHTQIGKSWKALRGLLVSSLTRVMVEDAFTKRAKESPVMADKELRYLKSALKQAASRGQRVDPAIFDIPSVNHKPRRGRILTVAQLYALERQMPEYLKRIVPLAGLVGARQSFWFNLTDEMLDLDAGTMLAPAELQKNGRDLRVFLGETEVQLFREQLLARTNGTPLIFPTVTGRVWGRHNFRKQAWDGAVKAAAKADKAASGKAASVFDGFTFHHLRHTAGSLMAHSGMEPPVAALRLGHTDGGALFLRTYRHLYSEELKRQAERYDAFLKAEIEQASADKKRTSRES